MTARRSLTVNSAVNRVNLGAVVGRRRGLGWLASEDRFRQRGGSVVTAARLVAPAWHGAPCLAGLQLEHHNYGATQSSTSGSRGQAADQRARACRFEDPSAIPALMVPRTSSRRVSQCCLSRPCLQRRRPPPATRSRQTPGRTCKSTALATSCPHPTSHPTSWDRCATRQLAITGLPIDASSWGAHPMRRRWYVVCPTDSTHA